MKAYFTGMLYIKVSSIPPPSSSDWPFLKTEEGLKILGSLRREKLSGEMMTVFRTLCREDGNELVHWEWDKK